jgi:hypothetical protein
MGSPAIFSGKRTKLLTSQGLLANGNQPIDNDGPLNLIKNSCGTQGSTVGWATYANSVAGPLPETGTGGTAVDIAVTATESTVGSVLTFEKTGGSNSQGSGISYDFSVPTIYVNTGGRVCLSAQNFISGGAPAVGTWGVYIYDITHGELITPFSPASLGPNSGPILYYFDLPVGMLSGRLIFHYAVTGTAGTATDFSFMSLGPNQVAYGLAGSDWQSYTPTGGWNTNTTYTGRWRRVGDSMEIYATVSLSGAPNAAYAAIDLPSGYSIDTAKLSDPSTLLAQSLGSWVGFDGSANRAGGITFKSATSVYLVSDGAGDLVSATVPATWASGDRIGVSFKVPIAGWSSNVSMGESSTFKISSYLANGTRVTSTPTQLGEYRCLIKNSSSNGGTDNAPAAPPSVANGMRIYGNVGYAGAGTSGQTGKWEIFVGKNKNIEFNFYRTTGRSGGVNVDQSWYDSGGTSVVTGILQGYDPVTGVATLDGMFALGTNEGEARAAGYALGSGTSGSSGVDDVYFDITVSENALMVGVDSVRSEVRVLGVSGYGSSGTTTRRFTTVNTNTGSAITYASDATNGDTFTINQDGIYAINYGDQFNAGANFGITLNSSSTSTATSSLAQSEVLAYAVESTANDCRPVSWTGFLPAGSVIRAQTSGTAVGSQTHGNYFVIAQVNN